MDCDNNRDIICSNISTTADHDSDFKLEMSSDANENNEDEYLVSKTFVHLKAIW